MNETYHAADLFPEEIFDHDNGTLTSVTDSAVVIVPPAKCRRLAISATADVYRMRIPKRIKSFCIA